MENIGALAILLAFCFAVYAVLGSLIGKWARRPFLALSAERALVESLGGGCQTPIGALASPVDGDRLDLVATVVALDGSRAVHERALGARSEAAALGARVGAALLAQGAGEILATNDHRPMTNYDQ